MDLVTKFIAAIRAGETGVVRELLDAYPALVQENTENGVSPVLLAAYHQHGEVLNLLVARKPKLTIFEAAAIGVPKRLNRKLNEDPYLLNAFSPDGFTALCLACLFNQTETVEMLLGKGAKVNLASRNEARLTPLHAAVLGGGIGLALLLLENGAEVNARQAAGYTPLHQAAFNGHPGLVELLLHFGANRHLRLDNGKTPFDIALEKGHQEVMTLLEEKNSEEPFQRYGT